MMKNRNVIPILCLALCGFNPSRKGMVIYPSSAGTVLYAAAGMEGPVTIRVQSTQSF